MLNATRAAAIVAVLTLSGSLALIAGPLGQSGDPAPPPAAEMDGSDVDLTPGFFTGTATIQTRQEPDITALVDRLEARNAGNTFTLDLDDPRVDGSTGTAVFDFDDFPVSGGQVGVFRDGSGLIENENGTWVLSSFHGAGAEPEDGSSYTFAAMTGEGAYDGLVGTMLMTDHDGAGNWQVVGSIFPEERVPSE